jgi:hypothetical protein
MKPRMILLTAASAAALAGGAAAGAVLADDGSSGSPNVRMAKSSSKAPHGQHAGAQTSARAKRLLHNPGLPAWIP